MIKINDLMEKLSKKVGLIGAFILINLIIFGIFLALNFKILKGIEEINSVDVIRITVRNHIGVSGNGYHEYYPDSMKISEIFHMVLAYGLNSFYMLNRIMIQANINDNLENTANILAAANASRSSSISKTRISPEEIKRVADKASEGRTGSRITRGDGKITINVKSKR